MSHTDMTPAATDGAAVQHPLWCTKEVSDLEQIHVSQRFACDPFGEGHCGIELQLQE